MSGVKVGSRLEHLETLYVRVGHELEAERLAVARGERSRPMVAPRPTMQVPVVMDAPLPPAAVIREWAISNGYLPETQRTGPIPVEVRDLYREQVMS